MSTYEKKSLLDNRYQLLATSSNYTYDDDNLTSYADFLKKFGRYIGKDGFIDSQNTVHRSKLKQKDIDRTKTASSSPVRSTKSEANLLDLVKANEDRRKIHDKHLKVIEDQMIQSKQEERAFKRQEGDVKKDQRSIRHAMRELDQMVSKKKLEADKSLAKNLEEKNTIEVEFQHNKEKTIKERTEKNLEVIQQVKDKGRKNLLMCNDLARQYKIKMNELDIKQSELNNIFNDYMNKVRSKEEEEIKIKKEISEIALALNMEAKKIKNDLFDFQKNVQNTKDKQVKNDLENEAMLEEKIAKTSNYIKNYDMTRRRLSHEAQTEKSNWLLRQREATRRIADTRNNLESIYQRQRNMNEVVQIAEQDRKANEIAKKIEEVNERKMQLATRSLSEKKEKSEAFELLHSQKASKRYIENEIKQHEDHLKHFQKVTQKEEEQEHELYKTVKDSEFSRRKQEKEVRELQDKLNQKKKENSVLVKEIIAKAFAEEQNLQQALVKEKAKLDKLHAIREDTYGKLLSHREKVRADRQLLQVHEKEHNRLLRVMDKTEQMNNSS